ncbi:hypothetical protein R3P38DRAFT_2793485 [Favolaschia claudopus]|uniref:Uncharacterized protein n=1 Tax=Favolaschia claudopus TaxID=2862362 RepID=A0AAW0ACM2_9AGAR
MTSDSLQDSLLRIPSGFEGKSKGKVKKSKPYATFAPPTQWPAHIQEFVYGPRSPAEILADAIPPAPAPVDPSPMVTLVDACLEGPPPQPLPIPPRAVTSVMRDWSALRVECVNPWRTIRRRKQRLRPRYAGTCPRAPRVVTPAAVSTLSPPKPVPVMSLLEGRSQPLPLQPTQVFALVPLHPDDPIHPDDVPTNDLPLPLACPCPDDHLAGPRLLSADTPFGWVGSSLALACAWELPEPDKVLDALAFLAWGSSEDVRRDCLADLPHDLFIFLGVLSMLFSPPIPHHFPRPFLNIYAALASPAAQQKKERNTESHLIALNRFSAASICTINFFKCVEGVISELPAYRRETRRGERGACGGTRKGKEKTEREVGEGEGGRSMGTRRGRGCRVEGVPASLSRSEVVRMNGVALMLERATINKGGGQGTMGVSFEAEDKLKFTRGISRKYEEKRSDEQAEERKNFKNYGPNEAALHLRDSLDFWDPPANRIT